MGIPCDKLIESIIKYKEHKKRGALALIAKNTGVHISVLSRLSTGKQKTIELDTWKKIYKYNPVFFPPPNLPDQISTDKQFSSKAIEIYPFIKRIIEDVNEAAQDEIDKETVLKICRNSIDTELLKIKENAGGCMQRSA